MYSSLKVDLEITPMTIFNRTFHTLLLCFMALILAACSEKQRPVGELVKLSPELQASYDRSCKLCHETPATNSPQTGDIAQWSEILDKGIEETVRRALEGYKGMPPGGQCFECSPEQIEQLIRYMAQVTQS